MTYLDELHPRARQHFQGWLDRLRDGDAATKNCAWGLDLPHAAAADDNILRHVATHVFAWGPYEVTLFVSDIFGGPDDDSDAIAAAEDLLRSIQGEVDAPSYEREAGRLARINERVSRGEHSDADVVWLEERAEVMADEDVLRMQPFDTDQADAREISRRVVRGRRDHSCHYSGRCIPAGAQHLVLREVVDGEILTTRHSLLAAYLDVVAGDGSLAELLVTDEAEPLAA